MYEFDGSLSVPGDEAYEQARVGPIFNARRPARLPTAILEAASPADVVAGVLLARERGWKVSVRSGGHSWPAWGVRDNALLIDLGHMRQIDVDPKAALVSVQPAVTGHELVPTLAEQGLMFQIGHAPGVGLGGYLLQGGAGWNTRGWGWACERIQALDVVTADGQLVRATTEHNEDLLWAARGAGHGFCGVVTRFELETRPLPRAIRETSFVFSAELYGSVLEWALRVRSMIDPIVEFGVSAAHRPEYEGVVITLFAVAFADSETEARRSLEPFERCPLARRAVRAVVAQPTTLDAQLESTAQRNPSNLRYASDSAWLNAGPDTTVELLRNAFLGLPTRHSEALWMNMGSRPLPDMAFSLQTDSYFATFAKWEDESEDETCLRWVRGRMDEIDPISEGVFLGDCDLALREAPFMREANRAKLEEIRSGRDPDRLFCSYMTAHELAAEAASLSSPGARPLR